VDLALVDPRQIRRVRDRVRVGSAEREVARRVLVEQCVEEGAAEPADAALAVGERHLAEPRGTLVRGTALAQRLGVRVRLDLDGASILEADPQPGHERASHVERLRGGNDALRPRGIRRREELLRRGVGHMVDPGTRRRTSTLLGGARAGKEADRQVGARPDEPQGVEVELVETRGGLPDLFDSPVPRLDGVGLVEPADVLEVSPERIDRRSRLQLGEKRPAPTPPSRTARCSRRRSGRRRV
jgi:hypothetical protein